MPSSPYRLLEYREAAAMIGVNERTLRDYIVRGIGPRVTRIGGYMRFRHDHIVQWLDACSGPEQQGTRAYRRKGAEG